MPLDPLSTVLAAALYAPIALNATKQWRSTSHEPQLISETYRPVMASSEPETYQLLAETAAGASDRISDLVDELNRYTAFPAGWDGAHSVPPTQASSEAAHAFLHALPPGLPLPVPMLSPTGEIGFYWNDEGGYADISFDETGAGSFFSRTTAGVERFVADVHADQMTRAWFFEVLGEVTAPTLAAA